MRIREERWTAELALLVVCLIWGCNFAIMKTGLADLHPFAFNTIRLTLSAVFLGAVHYRGGGHRLELSRRSWIHMFFIGLIGYFGYQVFFMTGLARTESGNTALILSSSPIFTALIGFMLGERLRRLAWIGLAVASVGTAVISLQGDLDFGSRATTGNILILCASCAWGSYTALVRGLAERVPAATLAFYTTAMTLPIHWIISFDKLGPLWSGSIPLHVWGSIVYSGLLGTGYAYVLWNIGLKELGASHTAGFINLVPVIALAVGWLALGEPITAFQIAGGALVLGGVWTMLRARVKS